jgi:hypothetical protein
MATEEDSEGGDAGPDGGNSKTSTPVRPPSMDRSTLKKKFQGALARLERTHDKDVVAVDVDDDDNVLGNNVLLWLGTFDLHEYSDRWDEPTTDLYQMVDESLPGSDPHWTIMAPAVSVDGGTSAWNLGVRNGKSPTDNAHGPKAAMVRDIAGTESAVAFSWRWSHMDEAPDEYRDLTKTSDIVKHLLSLPDSGEPA